jgi:hypothetical protein
VNWPEPLLEVVRCQEIIVTCELLQQAVFETEDRCWSDDCRFGEDLSDDFLASCLTKVNFEQYHPSALCVQTFVRKNSDEEFLSAL